MEATLNVRSNRIHPAVTTHVGTSTDSALLTFENYGQYNPQNRHCNQEYSKHYDWLKVLSDTLGFRRKRVLQTRCFGR